MAGQTSEPGSSRVFRCNICDTYSTNEQNFITHLESSQHLEQLLLTDLLSQRSYRKLCLLDKLQSQVCNICGTEFGDFTDFITHMKKKHSAQKVELYLHSLHGSSANSGSVCSDKSENAGRRESLQSNSDFVYCDTCEMSINSRTFNFHTLSKGHEANLNRISMMQSSANSKLKSTHQSTSQCPQEECVPKSAVASLNDFTFPANIYNITSRRVNSDEVSMEMNNNCISDDLETLHSKYYCQICLVDCKTADKLDIHQSESDHLKREKMLVESSKSGAANTCTATTVDPDEIAQFKCTVCQTKWMDNNNRISHESSARHKNALDVYSRSFASINAEKGSVRCTLCTLDCSSQVCFVQHEKGKKHKAFLDEFCWERRSTKHFWTNSASKKSFGSNPGSVSSASKQINSFSSENSFNSELRGSSSGSSKVVDFSRQPVKTRSIASESFSTDTQRAITSKVTIEDSQVCSFPAINGPLSNVCSKCGKTFPVQTSFGNTTKVDFSEPWVCQSCYFDFKDVPDEDDVGDIQCYICGIFLPMDQASVREHCRTETHIHNLLQIDRSLSRLLKTNPAHGKLTNSSLDNCNSGSYFGCTECNVRFNLTSLRAHIRAHSTPSKSAVNSKTCHLRCAVCELNIGIINIFNAVQHCRTSSHLKKLLQKFPGVAKCVKTNPDAGALTHTSLENCNENDVFECAKCQSVTLSLRGLQRLLGGKHNEANSGKLTKLKSSECILESSTEEIISKLNRESTQTKKETTPSINESSSNIEELVAFCRQQLPGIVNKTNSQRISMNTYRGPDVLLSNTDDAQYHTLAPEDGIAEKSGDSSVQFSKSNEKSAALIALNCYASASKLIEKSKDYPESSSSLTDFLYYQHISVPRLIRCRICEKSIDMEANSVVKHCKSASHTDMLLQEFPDVVDLVKINPDTGLLTNSSAEKCHTESVFGNEFIFKCELCFTRIASLQEVKEHIHSHKLDKDAEEDKLFRYCSKCGVGFCRETELESNGEFSAREFCQSCCGKPRSDFGWYAICCLCDETIVFDRYASYKGKIAAKLCRTIKEHCKSASHNDKLSLHSQKEPPVGKNGGVRWTTTLVNELNCDSCFKCGFCGNNVTGVKEFRSHLRKHKELECYSAFNTEQIVNTQQTMHSGGPSFTHDNSILSSRYGANVQEEVEIVSSEDDSIEEVFSRPLVSEFKHQVKVASTQFYCSLCQVQCYTAVSLEQHNNGLKHLKNSVLSSRYGANVQEDVELLSSEDHSIEEVSSRPLVSELSSITDNRNYKTSVLTKNTLTSATLDGSASGSSGTVPKSFANIQGFSEQQDFGLLELPKFTCGKCGVVFDGNRSSFLEHQETHEDLDIWDSPCGSDPELKSTSFLCSICSSVIKGSGPALNHYDAHRMHIIQELFYISALTIMCLHCNKLLPFLECEIHAHTKSCDQNIVENGSSLPRFGCCLCKISYSLTDISIYVTCTLSQHLEKLKLLAGQLEDKEQNTDWNTAREHIFVHDNFDLHALCYHTELERRPSAIGNKPSKSSKGYYCNLCQCRCFSESHEKGPKHKATLKSLANFYWKGESRDSFNDLSTGSTDLPKNSLSRVPGNLPSAVPGNVLKVVPGTSTGLPKSSNSRTSRIMPIDSARGSLYDALSNAAVLQDLKPKKGDKKKKTKPGATSEQKTMSTKTNKTLTSKSNIPNAKTISNSDPTFSCVCGAEVIMGNLKSHLPSKTHKKKLCQTFFGSDHSCVKCGVKIGSSPNSADKLSHLSSVHYIA